MQSGNVNRRVENGSKIMEFRLNYITPQNEGHNENVLHY